MIRSLEKRRNALQNISDGPALMNAPDIAKMIGVTPETVRNWAMQGKMPEPVRVAGIRRWRRWEIVRHFGLEPTPAASN